MNIFKYTASIIGSLLLIAIGMTLLLKSINPDRNRCSSLRKEIDKRTTIINYGVQAFQNSMKLNIKFYDLHYDDSLHISFKQQKDSLIAYGDSAFYLIQYIK